MKNLKLLLLFIIFLLFTNCDRKNDIKLPIYLDNQATTPIDIRVLKVMTEAFANNYGNPHSQHQIGQKAHDALDKARKQVANVINAEFDEVIFTSGATESNNIAIKGMIDAYSKTSRNHIITTTIEHECIKQSCCNIEDSNIGNTTYICPEKNGIINLEELEKAITSKTLMISIIGVNNEIGVIQNLEAIGKIAKKHNVFFHTDCSQAFGKIPLDVKRMNIDLMSISGHKIYGPKGVGALYVRKSINISPLIHGGGQEHGIRSGTVPVPIIVGFGEASEIAVKDMKSDYERITKLSNKLQKSILNIPGTQLNGDSQQRYLGCMNFSFKCIKGMDIVESLKDKVALSVGSACGSSHGATDSYVIKSILKTSPEFISGAVRFGIGRFTTEAEIDYTISAIKETVAKLRKNKNDCDYR